MAEIRNHSSGGRFDFVTQAYFDDAFAVNGSTYNASQFGNFLAGYSGAYHGFFFGYLGTRVGGVVYDVFEEGARHTDLDRESIPFIQDGAALGRLHRDNNIERSTNCN